MTILTPAFSRTIRAEFSTKTKKSALVRSGGNCEECGLPFSDANPPEYDHDVENWEEPDNSLENCKVLGKKCCHKKKTAQSTKRRAKANAIASKNANIRRSTVKIQSRPFPKAERDRSLGPKQLQLRELRKA